MSIYYIINYKKRETDLTTLKNNIDHFFKNILKIKNQMKTLNNEYLVQCNKRKHRADNELKREAIKVCYNIISQEKQRFDFSSHLVTSNLFFANISKNMINIFQTIILMKQ